MIVVIAAGLGVVVYFLPSFFAREETSSAPRLSTGGTSSVSIILENGWRSAYRKVKGVEVDYESTGSTRGLEHLMDNHYAIAFTHSPMTAEQRQKAEAKGGEIMQVPVALCAVTLAYNVKELKQKPPLKFTPEVLAGIFLGVITKWNDPALKQLNEGADLPDLDITAVHRSDSSGTTYIFTDYLNKTSTLWQKKLGKAGSEISWPGGIGAARNHGVAERVLITEGAIGYVDLAHALALSLSTGAVQNKDQTAFVGPEPANMTAAAQAIIADISEDLTFDLANRTGKDSYPICGGIWAVCYQKQPSANGQRVADFLHWVTHDGQQFAESTANAPLPRELVERAEQKLQSIKTR
jgi:phosphate transport system substrate-binding protein